MASNTLFSTSLNFFCPCLQVHLKNRLLQSCNIYYNIHTVMQPNHFYEEHRSCNVVLALLQFQQVNNWLMCLLVHLHRQTYFQYGQRNTRSNTYCRNSLAHTLYWILLTGNGYLFVTKLRMIKNRNREESLGIDAMNMI